MLDIILLLTRWAAGIVPIRPLYGLLFALLNFHLEILCQLIFIQLLAFPMVYQLFNCHWIFHPSPVLCCFLVNCFGAWTGHIGLKTWNYRMPSFFVVIKKWLTLLRHLPDCCFARCRYELYSNSLDGIRLMKFISSSAEFCRYIAVVVNVGIWIDRWLILPWTATGHLSLSDALQILFDLLMHLVTSFHVF